VFYINYIPKKRSLIPFLALTLYIAVTLFTEVCADGVKAALELCLFTLLPSLFPFCFATNLLLECDFEKSISRPFSKPFKRLFHLDPNLVFPYIIGMISGYPQGSIAVMNIYKKGGCTRAEAEHALSFCNNTGIGFIIGVCRTLGFSKWDTLCIFSAQFAASLLYALIFRPKNYPKEIKADKKNEKDIGFNVFSKALTGSLYPMALVCGYVMIFGVISEFAERFFAFLSFSPAFCAFLFSFLEISNASYRISLLPSPLALPLLSFAVVFSGLCVHLQIYSCVRGVLKTKKLILNKLFQAVFAFLITLFVKMT